MLSGVLVAAMTGTAFAAQSPAKYDGKGFDTCVAPSTGFMRSWLGSPYRAVNIYLGPQLAGDCRGQPELTAQWVRTVRSNGWRLLPLYVGRQAPCRDDHSQKGFTAPNAASTGRAAAVSAVQRMTSLRLGKHNPVYLDVEPYDTTRGSCSAAVVRYVEAWTRKLHSRGYVAGVYAHATRGIEPIARQANPRPDDVWWALFNGDTGTSYPTLHGHWRGHRIHQYAAQRAGQGTTYNNQGPVQIDKNTIHADVVGSLSASSVGSYRASTPYDTQSQTFLTLKARQSPSTSSAVVNSYAYGDSLAIACQTTGEEIYGDDVWDQLTDGSYVFDLYTTTTGGLGFTRSISRC